MTKRDLAKQHLDYTNLAGTDLSDTDLSKSSLRRANLKGVKLRNADLSESDLHGAHLEHADVTGANLQNADLSEANLHGVDLERAASTDGVRLAGAKGVPFVTSTAPDVAMEHAHLERAVAELNDAIARAATSVYNPPGRPEPEASQPLCVAHIGDLRSRRDALEDRLVSLLDEGIVEQ